MISYLLPLLSFLLLLKEIIPVGVITSDVSLPITNTLANANEYAAYNFRFILSTKLFQGGFIEVTFPNQFESGLGIPLLPTCSVNCSRADRQVSFYFPNDLFPGLVYNATIYSIRNPPNVGGTGQFIINSKRGANVLDQTHIHGVLGVGGAIGTLTSTTIAVDSSSGSSAGDITKYIVSFKTVDFLPSNIYVKLYLPKNAFVVSPNPSCSSFEINGFLVPGKFKCSYDASTESIEIRGFSTSLPSGSEAGISISMRNPNYSYTTGTFDIVIFKESTTLAYTRKLAVQGVPITAGGITQINIQPVDNFILTSRYKLMWYRLRFKLTNPLPSGAMIDIKIPDSITLTVEDVLGAPSTFYVENGIEDISNEDPIDISSVVEGSSRYIRIKNFKPQSQPDQMNIVMLITLPASNGLSLPFEIKSYTTETQQFEIDKDLSTARIDVSSLSKPAGFTLTQSLNQADGKTYIDLEFSITPDKSIAGFGQFKLLLDENLVSTGVSNQNCKVWMKTDSQFVDSPLCTKRDRDVFIKLAKDPYTLGITSRFQLNGIIRSPELAGKYYVEVQSISPLNEVLETYTAVLSFTATPLAAFEIKPFPLYRYQPAMHEIAFQTPYKIPASAVQNKATDLVSFIQLQYTSVTGSLKQDLGQGFAGSKQIPCKAIRGLTPITGANVNCTLTTGASPSIVIQNFQTVPINSNIQMYIPNIENPNLKWDLTARVVTKQNRILKIISDETLQYNSNSDLPTGRISQSSGLDPNDFFVDTQDKVSSDFSVTHEIEWSGTIPANSRLLFRMPTYDQGFVPEEGHITCKIDTMTFNCYQFQGIDWVYGQTLVSLTVDTAVAVGPVIVPPTYVTLSNLRWPRFSPLPSSYDPDNVYSITIMKEDTKLEERREYARFPFPQTNPFLVTTLNVDKKRRNEVDSTYTFTFTPTNNIPQGSTIILELPAEYNLIASFPRVQITYPELTDESTTSKVTHHYTANIVTINNMDEHPERVPFRIVIKGIKNPNIGTALTGFSITVMLNGNEVNKSLNFLSITLDTLFTPGLMLANQITIFPTNNLILADYTFNFTPQTKLSIGSQIHIAFPSEYVTLPQSPICSVEGGLQTFESCLSLADEIVIKLDTPYITGSILLTIKNIQNPNVVQTQAFEIYSFYDGTVVDNTKTTTQSQRQVPLNPPASIVSMKEFYFDPVNEGEISTYVISFVPTNNIQFGQLLNIKFPDTFDQRLGNNVEIFILSGLKGDIKTRVYNWIVEISNFDKYSVSPDNPIKVEITGVINPNKPFVGHSGYIAVGAIYTGSNKYEDYLEQAAVVETTAVAGWLSLNAVTPNHTKARTQADYFFNLTVNDAVPKTELGGKIYVDLPVEFEVSSGVTRCSNMTQNLGSDTSCVRNKRTVALSGHLSELTSQIAFNIFDIPNPLDEVKTGIFFVRSYDGFKREIIQRSFENLDPYSFGYKYPGPLIVVNEDQPIYVERGTQSKDVYLVSQEIMALNLTFFPSTPGFSLVTSPLTLSIGEKSRRFRVSVSLGFPEGDYYIYWTTKNEIDPPLYTPLKKTRVIVTKKGNVPIDVADINDIALRGNSLPVVFSVDFAPDIGIEVLVTLKSNYPGISLTSPSVIFNSGDTLNTFTVFFNTKTINAENTVQSGEVLLDLIGVNKDVYTLPKQSLKFNIISEDTRTPEITDIRLISVNQTSVRAEFFCSDIATAYYIVMRKGSAIPSLEEVKSQGPPDYETTETQYGLFYVSKNLTGQVAFNNLYAETEYEIYVFLQDRGENIIEAPGYVAFNTSKRYEAAFFDLRFKQTYINSAERKLIGTKVAFLLSLIPEKVEEKKYKFDTVFLPSDQANSLTSTTGRVLQVTAPTIDEITSTLTLTVIAVPNSPIYPKPAEIALLMNREDKKIRMANEFSNYDTTFEIKPYDFTRYNIEFSSNPTYRNVTFNSVIVSCNLDNFGFVYAVAVRKSEDLGKPSHSQVQRGVDYQNVPLPSGSIEIKEKFIIFSFTVGNLDPDTQYNMYVSAGNAHPGYPDMQSTKEPITLEFTTLKAPIIPRLSLDFSSVFEVMVVSLVFLFGIAF